MATDINKKSSKGGRKPKLSKSIHRYAFRLTDEENSKFLSLYDRSGALNYASFITSVIFEKPIKTVQINKGTADFYMRLTTFHSQFRSVGVNYNQIVKLLYRNFSDKKAAAYLFKLEKETVKLASLCKQIHQTIKDFDEIHIMIMPKNDCKNQ